MWRLSPEDLSVIGAATAIPMPLMHTVDLNAVTVDSEAGPQPARHLDLGALGA